MSLCSNQTHPLILFYFNKAGKNARQVQIRKCFSQPLKERLDEGREMRRGKENTFGDRDFICFSSKTKKAEDGLRCMLDEGNTLFRMLDEGWYDCRALSSFRPLAYWDSSLRALPALSNKEFRLGPGKRWQQQKGRGPCSCCARPLLSQWGSRFGIYYKRENPLQITPPLLGSVWNGRERTFLDI